MDAFSFGYAKSRRSSRSSALLYPPESDLIIPTFGEPKSPKPWVNGEARGQSPQFT